MSIELSSLKVLAYFDLFDYPVIKSEILQFLDQQVRSTDLDTALENLTRSGQVFRFGEFYCLRNSPDLIIRRKQGNEKASWLLKTAYRISGFLYKFPFVRGVAISGSLSKNFADEKADIDYFIITKSNRLWIARTLMHLYKKFMFLTRHQHFYCMNYYVDEQALKIEERNVFTATEIVTLIPVCGNGSLKGFFAANEWTNMFYPNYNKDAESLRAVTHSWLKRSIEWIFNNQLGNRLDNYLMRLTTRRWNKKELNRKLNIKGTRMALKTNKHFSKPNPKYFQQYLLKLYEERLKQLNEKTCVTS